MWESDKNSRKHHIQESQEVSPFPAGDHKVKETGRQAQNTNSKKIHKRSTPLEWPVRTVIKFILIKEVCNFNSNLLKSGYDQEKTQSHTADQPTVRKSHITFRVLSHLRNNQVVL